MEESIQEPIEKAIEDPMEGERLEKMTIPDETKTNLMK